MRLIAANGPGPPLEPRGDLIGVRELFHHDLKATDLSSMTEKLSQRRHEMLGGSKKQKRYLNDVRKIFGILDPLPPFVRISRNLSVLLVTFWVTTFPSPK